MEDMGDSCVKLEGGLSQQAVPVKALQVMGDLLQRCRPAQNLEIFVRLRLFDGQEAQRSPTCRSTPWHALARCRDVRCHVDV